MADLKSYFRLLRVTDWCGFFLIALFGFVLSDWFLYPVIDSIIFFLILFLFLGFGFSVNDCFDVKEDKLSKKKNPIARGKISFENALIFSVILAFFGLILSTHFGSKSFFLYFALILLSFFYSSPPLRFKSKFLLDILSHGLFFGTLLFFLPLIIFNSELALFHYLIGLSIFWFSAIIELKNHLRDYEGDKKAGLKTTVCVLGKERAELLLKFLEIFYPLTIFPIFLFSENLILIMLFAIISGMSLIKKNNTISKYIKLPYNLLQKFIIAIWEISKLVF